MSNLSIGQYYPAKSVIHSLDPRFKLISSVLFLVCVFLVRDTIGFAVLFVSVLGLVRLANIPFRVVFKALRPVVFVLIFTSLISLFMTKGGPLLFHWKFISIYEAGIYHVVFIAIRIFALVVGVCVLLTYTTTPIELTDGLETLFKPLELLHIPVQYFAMMMALAIRFIPILMEETDRIMAAQKSRGSDLDSRNVFTKIKSLMTVIIPLFVSSFRRADDLAIAMECRCYYCGKKRTRMRRLKSSVNDFMFILLFVLFIVLVILINKLKIGYSM